MLTLLTEALQLGARGVVYKDSATRLLLKAIGAVMAGTVWLGPETLSDLMDYLPMQTATDKAHEHKFGTLSHRGLEIVRCLVRGLTNREIEDLLGLSHHTVKNYLFRIFDKLGVSSRVELAFLAAQFGSGRPADADTAGFAVKRPRSPNFNSGSAAANLDDVFDDREGTSHDGAPTIRSAIN